MSSRRWEPGGFRCQLARRRAESRPGWIAKRPLWPAGGDAVPTRSFAALQGCAPSVGRFCSVFAANLCYGEAHLFYICNIMFKMRNCNFNITLVRSPRILRNLEGSFSAVSKPIFGGEHLFCSIFRDLQYLRTSALTLRDLQTIDLYSRLLQNSTSMPDFALFAKMIMTFIAALEKSQVL